ncbi:hypothetical protein Mtai_v1c27750 (plasmid) [Meiothermus taiwanensis WR-220]|jgi:transcriptional regulator with XRE-family HTH domain|uniref:Uncharacterized protein n=3 Tax=Meiothermus taiwanensis TaxID=172827 RepID=A0A399E0A4_9DEIN|nr:hypothetical protein Mtai_v1c27750 [Meiothermus taiwanensis WR-220]RIH76999.1 hypothetical protein Mcate_01547 [Meiothermus taiwanensis]
MPLLPVPQPPVLEERVLPSPGTILMHLGKQISSTGYIRELALLTHRPLSLEESDPAEIPAREKLEYIETALGLRVVRLAELLGVSRQALYDWKEGRRMSEENHRRLDALYKAARRFREAGLRPDYTTLHRRIGGELEFLQALGQDPLNAVEKLIAVTERGEKQRAWLKRLENRPERGSIDDELPPHYPGE